MVNNYSIKISKPECLILIAKEHVQNDLYLFSLNKWLEGSIITFGTTHFSSNSYNENIGVQTEYTEVIDENYIKEKERLEIGL